ncbi:Hint domain-containing protein [Oceanomicrobium pacificus]|uniref:Hedgehog/Intein (Hint) domain-containing protein n=1 Tax=Oceanomicrobium pacificus TaxID=2692916 RepID=A0A6B0TR31_9RHOB|nr:Hint domain-containing protein [Oceanomicrobium pacificus]MXU64208.1 hypothetical protein [Oceanomicrobium pacificus]
MAVITLNALVWDIDDFTLVSNGNPAFTNTGTTPANTLVNGTSTGAFQLDASATPETAKFRDLDDDIVGNADDNFGDGYLELAGSGTNSNLYHITLDEALTIGGETYPAGTKVEVETRYVIRPAGGTAADDITIYTLRLDTNFDPNSGTGTSNSGTNELIASSAPLIPGTTYNVQSGSDGPYIGGANDPVVPCFTPGARILTEAGWRAVEEIRVGDRVQTKDNGLQTVRWIGRRDLGRAELARDMALAPVCIPAGALGAGLPERDLIVSPQHRMLIAGPSSDLYFGTREVFVPAKALLATGRARMALPAGGVSYLHLLFDRHEVLFAEGSETESFHPGEFGLQAVDAPARAELFALFPELDPAGLAAVATARTCLTVREALVLV